MGTPFPCPDHSFAWLYKGFSSCLRTSHPSPHGQPNWKPQKAIPLKALCSESSTCLAAPALAHGAVPRGHGHTERLHTWNNTAASPGGKEGRRGWQLSQMLLPLPRALCLHPTGNANTLPGARLLKQGKVSASSSLSIGDVTSNKNCILVLETPNSSVTYAL